jgi:hypothetical protein
MFFSLTIHHNIALTDTTYKRKVCQSRTHAHTASRHRSARRGISMHYNSCSSAIWALVDPLPTHSDSNNLSNPALLELQIPLHDS